MKFKYLYRPTILKYLLTLYCLNLFIEKKKKNKTLGDQHEPNGEGNGNPLQYSCLENSMDGADW